MATKDSKSCHHFPLYKQYSHHLFSLSKHYHCPFNAQYPHVVNSATLFPPIQVSPIMCPLMSLSLSINYPLLACDERSMPRSRTHKGRIPLLPNLSRTAPRSRREFDDRLEVCFLNLKKYVCCVLIVSSGRESCASLYPFVFS